MDIEEIKDLLRWQVESCLSVDINLKQGMYHGDKYIEVRLQWNGETFSSQTMDLPGQYNE